MRSQAGQGEGGSERADLERLRAPLMRFFLRRVGDRAVAEDLTQDAFTRMLAAADRVEVQDPEAFIFRIALNLLGDRARRSMTRQQSPMPGADMHRISLLTNEFVEDRTPERVLLAKHDVAAVVRALDELGERTRDIFVLFRLERMKHNEIAALFGVSRGTVEKEVMKATHHLAIRFGKKK